MPYNQEWNSLAPCSLSEFISRAQKAGYELDIRKAQTVPAVEYLVRLQNGQPMFLNGVPLRAVLSPNVGDKYATIRHFCDKLQIPRALFNV